MCPRIRKQGWNLQGGAKGSGRGWRRWQGQRKEFGFCPTRTGQPRVGTCVPHRPMTQPGVPCTRLPACFLSFFTPTPTGKMQPLPKPSSVPRKQTGQGPVAPFPPPSQSWVRDGTHSLLHRLTPPVSRYLTLSQCLLSGGKNIQSLCPQVCSPRSRHSKKDIWLIWGMISSNTEREVGSETGKESNQNQCIIQQVSTMGI